MKPKLFLTFAFTLILAITSSACGMSVQTTPSASATLPPNTATMIPLTATLTVTPTVTPTATPIPTPTTYFIGNGDKVTIKAGETVSLSRWGWVAATEELVQEFINALEITMKINGQTVSEDFKKYWSPFAEYHSDDYGDGYISTWIYPLTDNPVFQIPGTYHVEVNRRLIRTVSDGFVDPNTQKQNWMPAGSRLSTLTVEIEVIQ